MSANDADEQPAVVAEGVHAVVERAQRPLEPQAGEQRAASARAAAAPSARRRAKASTIVPTTKSSSSQR